jgi:hypothetical protein
LGKRDRCKRNKRSRRNRPKGFTHGFRWFGLGQCAAPDIVLPDGCLSGSEPVSFLVLRQKCQQIVVILGRGLGLIAAGESPGLFAASPGFCAADFDE